MRPTKQSILETIREASARGEERSRAAAEASRRLRLGFDGPDPEQPEQQVREPVTDHYELWEDAVAVFGLDE